MRVRADRLGLSLRSRRGGDLRRYMGGILPMDLGGRGGELGRHLRLRARIASSHL